MDMKKVLAPLVLVALAVTGCNQTTTKSTTKDGKTLKVTATKSVTIEQGGTAKVKVSIERKGFEDEVTVKFDKLPEGVTVEETDGKLAKGVKDREFTLKATSAAKAGKATAKISASGGGVDGDQDDLAIEVKEGKAKTDAAADLKKKRDELNTTVQAKMKDIDVSLKELHAEAKAADAKAKVDIEKQITALEEQRKKLDVQVGEIQTTTADAWEAFSARLTTAADELQKGASEAAKKFKKK